MATDGSGVITSTANTVYTALIASAAAMALVNVEKVATTTGLVAAVAYTNLASGAAGFLTDLQTGISEKTRGMIFSLETHGLRVTFDGTSPTEAVGILIPAGFHRWLDPSMNWNRMLQRMRMISDHVSEAAVLNGVLFELQ